MSTKHKKVLFLDIDGVVNSEETLKKQYLRLGRATILGIDPELAAKVAHIVAETDCEVVLSSSWRHHEQGRQDVRDRVVDFIDITPTTGDIRGDEVADWLRRHETEKYAILDDDSDFHEWQPLFKTSFKEGLTDEIAEKVINHLGRVKVESSSSR